MTTVQLTMKFVIPKEEIADVDQKMLIKFVKEKLGIAEYNTLEQFHYYELENFKPIILEMFINNQKVLGK